MVDRDGVYIHYTRMFKAKREQRYNMLINTFF